MSTSGLPADRNDVLRAARLKRGWRSGEAAARAVTAAGREALGDVTFEVSPRTWRRWESARPGWPRGDCARALYAAFGRWPEDLGFDTPPEWIPAEREPSTQTQTPVPHLPDAHPSTEASAASAPVGRPHVDPAVIGYFKQQLEGHYRADMLLGPHDLIGIVSGQYALIDRLSRAARDETRRDLLRVGAAYAALIGWLYQDAGDLVASSSWRGVAQEASLKARDPLLIAYSLVNQAQLRTDLGSGPCVIDLCEAALANERGLPPKVRVMALQQQAHGFSLEGDRRSCDRVLDQAEALVSRVDDDLPWGNACRRTPVYLEVQRATCYGRLGLGKEAGKLWSQVLRHVPTTARRDRGVYSARFARAALVAGERDLAHELTREAVPVALDTGSVRLRRELLSLRTIKDPAQGTGADRRFDDILAPLTGRETT